MKEIQFFAYLLTLSCLTHAFHLAGNVLYDLESYGSEFLKEVELWQTEIPLTNDNVKTTRCDSERLLGGPNIWDMSKITPGITECSWKRKYTQLPAHKMVKIQMTFSLFGDWTSSEDHFSLYYSATDFIALGIPNQDFGSSSDTCASSLLTPPSLSIIATVEHMDTFLDLDIKGSSSISGSLAFRDITLTFIADRPTDWSNQKCQFTSGFAISPSSEVEVCGCENEDPLYPNSGKCSSCAETCKTCSGSEISSCTSCYYGHYLTTLGGCEPCSPSCATCSGEANFCTSCHEPIYLQDSECVLSCSDPYFPLEEEEEEEFENLSFCSLCPIDQYFYHWGTQYSCQLACNDPLERGKLEESMTCNFGCLDESKPYLYLNGNCESDCPLPYQERTVLSRQLCEFPCSSSEDYYAYWDGECESECYFSLEEKETADGNKYCSYPCGRIEFLYNDGHCEKTCPYPYRAKTFHSRNFCLPPCEKYLYWDETCDETCAPPLEIILTDYGTKVCSYPCEPEDFLYDKGKCHDICPESFIAETHHSRSFCVSPCKGQEGYAYWDGTCQLECNSPLIQEELEENNVICKFPCKDENAYLYADKTCVGDCPLPYQKSVKLGRNFCEFPCDKSENYAFWDGSCGETCSFPLEEQKTDKGKKYCTYKCDTEEFLSTTGDCQEACVSPSVLHVYHSRNICCGENQYFDDRDGKCQSLDLLGQFILPAQKIDKQLVDLTLIDRNVKSENSKFRIFNEEYTIVSSWVFFTLEQAESYVLDNWDTNTKCGCFQQVCGEDCAKGFECHTNEPIDEQEEQEEDPWLCDSSATRSSFCWSLISSGQKNYTSYSLKHMSTVMLTSYGGPGIAKVSPGFTINHNLNDQTFALNALVLQVTPRDNINLAKSFRYLESHRRVLRIEEFAKINVPPKMEADLQVAKCVSNVVDLPLNLISQSFGLNDQTSTAFHPYSILRKAKTPKLTTLLNQDILSPTGVVEWNNQATFDFLDPCNQQFLTLQITANGNFVVSVPSTQRLSNSEAIICIAVNDFSSTQYDLVLYELKNDTSVWYRSDRFVGLVSKDYLDDLTLRLTVKASQPLKISNIKVTVQFDTDLAQILITTSSPTTCQFYLSPSCHFGVSTSSGSFHAKHSLAQCDLLYEKAGYNCEGILGYFYPPANLVLTNTASQFIQEVQDTKSQIEAFTKPVTFKDDQGVLYSLEIWVTNWGWKNVLTKILVLSLFAFTIYIAWKIYKICKKKNDTKINNKEIDKSADESETNELFTRTDEDIEK